MLLPGTFRTIRDVIKIWDSNYFNKYRGNYKKNKIKRFIVANAYKLLEIKFKLG